MSGAIIKEMQITFFETTESEKNILTKLLPDHELGFYSEKLTPETAKLAGESEVVSVFIEIDPVSTCSRNFLRDRWKCFP